jgi:hypothetical protein
MVKVKVQSIYTCDVCGESYSTKKEKESCENRHTETPKFKMGEHIRVLSGDHAGEEAIITRVFHYNPSWGGEYYAHKVGYIAKVINSPYSRQLIQGVDMEGLENSATSQEEPSQRKGRFETIDLMGT